MLETPLHQFHVDHGANMVDFAGWSMPMSYGSTRGEHVQVRSSGGIFDVSHMGRLRVKGRHARRLLERICTRKIWDMQPKQCRYSLMCNERGGVRDDVLIYRMEEDEFVVVVNASNREKIVDHINTVKADGDLVCDINDETLKTAMVAIQGPNVMDLVSRVSSEIPTLKRYRFTIKNLMIAKLIVSRTGYTGEDGVEVILPANFVGMAMKLLMKDVKPDDLAAPIRPTGLGARDTLRLEAAMPLYGHELGEDINAMCCGVDFAISLDKADEERGEPFVGMEALRSVRDDGGPAHRIVGLEIDSKRTARQGMAISSGDSEIGVITSGCLSPTLEKSIAMALVAREHADEGTTLAVGKQGKQLDARVVPFPFYKKPKG